MGRFAILLPAVLALCMYASAPVAEPSQQPGQPTTTAKPKPKADAKKAKPRVEGSYTSEAEAKKACAGAGVVWVNSRSKIYHAPGTRDYGKTRDGFYMCQAQADRSGFRPVKGPADKGKKKDGKKT
jgi:hypothetical protein